MNSTPLGSQINKDLRVVRVSVLDAAVKVLIDQLNEYQISLYGLENCNLETPESLYQHDAFVVGAYTNMELLGIGGVKLFNQYGEVKRMFVTEEHRGSGVAKAIHDTLALYAKRQGMKMLRLETGRKHNAAIRFYKKLGYYEIEKFGNYKPNEVSIYFEKKLEVLV